MSLKIEFQDIVKSKHFLPLVIIAVALIFYNFFWDLMDAYRILSLTLATVYDMGAFYFWIWQVFHQMSIGVFIADMADYPITFLLSPLSLLSSPFYLVYLQTFWISVTAVPLYFIAYNKLGSRSISIMFSISFLLFFGIAGLNWFDIHRQSLFPLLFVSGYALYISGKYKASLIVLVISGLVHFPYMIFPILFFISEIIEGIFKESSTKLNKTLFFGLILTTVLLAVSYALVEYETGISGVTLNRILSIQPTGILQRLTTSIDYKFFTVLLILSPFLMLPLLSKKWLFFIFPFVILIFISGSQTYIFPSVFELQYLAMVVPFIYLGTIDVLSNASHNVFIANKEVKSALKFKINKKMVMQLKITITILILIVLLGTVYEPYGPLNSYSQTNFQLNEISNYNISLYNDYMEMVRLIPPNDPYVLYQNNMPQVVFQDPMAFYSLHFGEPNNYTYYIDGRWTTNIDYVIADPYSGYFTYEGTGSNTISLYYVVDYFLSTGNYGILGECDGIILLKKGYEGPPIIYVPENYYFSAEKLFTLSTSYRNEDTITGSDIINGETLWYGPYTVLQPGTYKVTLELRTSDVSNQNSFVFRYSYFNPAGSMINVELTKVTGSQFPTAATWTNISFLIKASNLYDQVEFAGQNFYWTGNFAIRGITLEQISYSYK